MTHEHLPGLIGKGDLMPQEIRIIKEGKWTSYAYGSEMDEQTEFNMLLESIVKRAPDIIQDHVKFSGCENCSFVSGVRDIVAAIVSAQNMHKLQFPDPDNEGGEESSGALT